MLSRKSRFLLTLAIVVSTGACRDCEGLGNTLPNGAIDPAVYEFGPITIGQECTAVLNVTNIGGASDLTINSSVFEDKEGDFSLDKVPPFVRIGGSEEMLVTYTAAGTVGAVQSVTVKLTTDDPREDRQTLIGKVIAIVTDAPAPAVKSTCGAEGDEVSPCAGLEFGAVQLNGTGLILSVTVLNDGTADMEVSAAVINGGNPDFTVESVRRGSTVVTLPQTVPAGRGGECGEPSTEDNTLIIDVRYVPSALGADVDDLVILTNAVNDDGTVTVALSGVGSDVGILMNPDTLNFGELAEGESLDIDVNVSNVGTADASVNFACLDLEDDDSCEADCNGTDAALNGTLSCRVTKVGGAAESEGFVLAPTDAQQGGDDERTITVTWAPIAGTTSIPSTAVLALHSNILGNRTFTAPLIGGSIGIIDVTVASDDTCPVGLNGVCVETTGDPTDTNTWVGEVTVRLTNNGSATVNIGTVTEDCGSTIADDYTEAAITDAALAPGESGEIVVTYANNDFSTVDPCNLLIAHDGAGAVTTVPLEIVAPQ